MKISSRSGYSKKYCAYYFHTCGSRDKGFKGFATHWILLLKKKFERQNSIDSFDILHMSYRHNLDDFERGYFLGKLEKERKITDF